MLSGGWLDSALVILALWIVILLRISWKLFRELAQSARSSVRSRLTIAGLGFSIVSLSALLMLHLSWLSAGVSQRLGVAAIKILALFVFWPALAGLLLSAAGTGKVRLLGIGTSMATGVWLFSLSIMAGISMGAPIVRHPTRFLIPAGYVGWVELKYGEKNATPLEMENGSYICRIPDSGVLATSSSPEEGWARDEYFYYSREGLLHPLKSTGWGLGGMIWGGSIESQQTSVGSKVTQIAQFFYVGTEMQYHRAVSTKESRPFIESDTGKTAP